MRLVDVSCSGADTADVTSVQSYQVPTGETVEIPPQQRALNRRTDLVTIGLGGNDGGLFSRLATACARGDAATCTAALDDDLTGRLATTTANLVGVVERVRARTADDAVVVLVGYPRIAGDTTCDRLPVDDAVLASVDQAVRDLSAAVRAAAEQTDARFLDLYGPSAGHDVCSDDPWINGVETIQGRALALHPFAVEQEAVAGLLAPLVRRAAEGRA